MAGLLDTRLEREESSIFDELYAAARQQEAALEQQGRRSVLGGLFSKEPVQGIDTVRFEGMPGLLSMLTPAAKAVDAPISAYRGLIPDDDMLGEALGTAGMAMGGGGVVAGRLPDGAVAANIPVMQGRSRRGLTDFFNPDGVSWGTDGKSTAEQFAGKDAGLVYKYNDEGKLEVSEADSYLPGQVYDLNYDLENPMQVPIKDTLWTREKELAKIAEAKAKGHDGLKIVHGAPDADGKYPKTDYVAFDPSQVSTVDAKAAKKNRIAEMRRLRRIERFGYDPEDQPTPASGGFDAYLSTVNPSGKRIVSENRPNLRMGDMYGMLPNSAQKVSSVNDVDIMRDGDDFYAMAYNPDVGEMDVVGYAQRGEGETDLMVVQEMQGKGVGGELQYQYRSANPTAPTGGLTEAGEGLLRNTYDRLRDDGTVNANASPLTGLMAMQAQSQPDLAAEIRAYLESIQ